MALDDDLLTCLALERQLYSLYGRWLQHMGADGSLTDILSRLADQIDRHRASLWDLALRRGTTPPPRLEPLAAPDLAFVEQGKLLLRRTIAELAALAEGLGGYERGIVERIRNEDEAQLRQLLIMAPEPTVSTLSSPGRHVLDQGLVASEPRWRPGIE